ncbi:MAG: hypothetical protein ACRCYU_12680 [Nocardioides sp.]
MTINAGGGVGLHPVAVVTAGLPEVVPPSTWSAYTELVTAVTATLEAALEATRRLVSGRESVNVHVEASGAPDDGR